MAYIKNTWVDQNVERPKTYEFTNNADGSVTLTDSFGLVTELGTPVNADNMNHIEDGIVNCLDKDLSNISAVGEKHFLNHSQIPNCILEKPHKIDLQLSSGNLTLKSGSTVIIPNGFESNGTTPKYSCKSITSDKAHTTTDSSTYNIFLNNSDTLINRTIECSFSGTTAPSGFQYMVWYDTTNNLVKYTSDSGSTWTSGGSLPICIATATNNAYSSIDQTFDGIGYIGSTIWVDKGIKAVYPDGKNADGTLKNVEFTTSQVLLKTSPSTNYKGTISFSNNFFSGSYTPDMKYDIETNYNKLGGVIKTYGVYGNFETDGNNKITSFNVKDVFRAMDYTDKNLPQIGGQWVNKYLLLCTEKLYNVGENIEEWNLNSYLPNDGYNYEVIVSLDGNSGATSGSELQQFIYFGENRYTVYRTRTPNSSTKGCGGGTAIAIIGTDRKLKTATKVSTSKSGNVFGYVFGYRRIGTNN